MMTPASPRHQTRCAEIVQAARGLLLEGGLEAFVMRTVATSVGMRLGNLQYYFATRDDLLEAVIRAEFANDLAQVEAMIEATVGVSPTTMDTSRDIAELARQMVENWAYNSGEVFLTLALLAYHSDRFRALNREVYESFYAAIGTLIRRLDRQAQPADVRRRALLMTALLDGVALQLHAAVHGKPEADVLIKRATGLLIAIATGN
jgi:AcrR family transcriptional regulator